jgi:hypothetical protein
LASLQQKPGISHPREGTAYVELVEALLDLLELLGYFGAFWLFVLSAIYRRECWQAWQAASLGGKGLQLIDAGVAAACGLAPLVLLGWLLR